MRFAQPSATLVVFFALVVCPALHAQIAPPDQDFVADIGNAPLKAPATTNFAPGNSFTMEGWVFLAGKVSGSWIMGKSLDTSGVDPFLSFALTMGGDGTTLQFAYSSGVAGTFRTISAPTALPLRTWTHIAAVMDGGTTRLLVNGFVVATGPSVGAPVSAPTVPFSLGIAYLSNGSTNYYPFPGYARQVRFWNVARTTEQIAAGMCEALPTDRPGLVAAWPLDESSGPTARDLSAGNRSLTGLAPARASVIAAGPFYSTTTTAVTDGSLSALNDGQVIDFDSDGFPDLVLFQVAFPTSPGTLTRLRAFRNQHDGTFADVTDRVLGNVTMVNPRDSFVGDFNGDGRPDLLVSGQGTDTAPFPGEQSKLFIQSADGRLVDETTTRLPQRIDFTHTVAVADIDGDGDLDIYMGNLNASTGTPPGPQIYLNNGAGFFTLAPNRLPLATGLGVPTYVGSRLVDVNRDGAPDLVLGNDGSATVNLLLMNDGHGVFTRDPRFIPPPKFGGPEWQTPCISSADFNGDGWPDLLLGTTGGTSPVADGRTITGYGIPGLQLLLNRGDGTFTDATATAGFTWSTSDYWVVWTRIVDLNGDGLPDILAAVSTSTGTKPRMFLNRGHGQFVDATAAYTVLGYNGFVHAADFFHDGTIALVTATPTSITVARSIKPLSLDVFSSGVVAPSRLVNLSVRSQAGTGDQTLITGFALGAGTGTKSLLVRATGPALTAFNVTGVLADPLVEVAPLGGTNVATNNDWGGTTALKDAFTSVGAFALSPDTSKDAALVFSPTPGAYTTKVTGVGGTTGVTLVEVYDAGTGNAPRLINLSARSQVGTGADVLITGFVVNGTLPKKLLIRASGPSLTAFGVSGTLDDPVLTLRLLGSDTTIAINDDWAGTAALKAAFASVGAFAFASDTSKDAAIAVELLPGAYTATVSGKNTTTGVALVEVYELP